MKDLLDVLKNYGVKPALESVGLFSILLFTMTLIPSLNFIPKAFLLYILTPFVFGR